MLRRNFTLLSSSSSAAAAAAFPSPYVPKPIPGRDWTPSTAANNSSHSRASASKLLNHQKNTFFTTSTTSSTTATSSLSPCLSSSSSPAAANATRVYRETENAVHHYEENIKPSNGFFHVPSLDYSIGDGIAPVISKTQAQLLRDVHHRGIVDKLNQLTIGSIYEGHTLDAVILHTAFDAENAAIHTCACEHWNHTFAWKSMVPFGTSASAKLREALTTSTVKQLSAPSPVDVKTDGAQERSLAMSTILANAPAGSTGLEKVKKMLSDACRDAYASGGGWVYLVSTEGGLNFEILRYRPGHCPITAHLMPLVCINMQLHARIADYTDEGSVNAYIEKSLQAINWKLAEKNWLKKMSGGEE